MFKQIIDCSETLTFIESLADLPLQLTALENTHIVCDSTVAHILPTSIKDQSKSFIAVKAGETLKSWSGLRKIVDTLLSHHIDRQDLIVAIGGGTLGDSVGLAASIIKRGINWINIPTTLLAQVDSSIGGKTAINTRHGKNLVGSIHLPLKTIVCLDFIKTLEQRQLNAGLAEIIKVAVISDRDLFYDLLNGSWQEIDWGKLTSRAIDLKLKVIGTDINDDPKGGGTRQYLNLGHTFGHAFEKMHADLLHGEAVALGLVAEAQLAEFLDSSTSISKEIITLLDHYHLPCNLDNYWPRRFERLWRYLRQDKKCSENFIQFILPQQIGKVVLWRGDEKTLTNFFGSRKCYK